MTLVVSKHAEKLKIWEVYFRDV